jgi:hypothetical protein
MSDEGVVQLLCRKAIVYAKLRDAIMAGRAIAGYAYVERVYTGVRIHTV